eukprot:snap_masked-scaffold591_size129331-processed-gene-0.9 protein:Tk08233 transcript:snap_masked-scaffold591_size129331-processed-gene-0.9-mRNA-1 annotation:"hypothetical protein AND_002473"
MEPMEERLGHWEVIPSTTETSSWLDPTAGATEELDPLGSYSPKEVEPPEIIHENPPSPAPLRQDSPTEPKKKRPRSPLASPQPSTSRGWTSPKIEAEPRSRRRRKLVQRSDMVSSEGPELSNLLNDSDEYYPSATDSDASFKSEDDPEKEWCVCQKPWNKRFMIRCDCCSKWFHASCMGMLKSEAKHIHQWVCPGCSIKKVKALSPPKKTKAPRPGPKKTPKKRVPKPKQPRLCIVCQKKPCRSATSVFCSDECIGSSVEQTAADHALPVGSLIAARPTPPVVAPPVSTPLVVAPVPSAQESTAPVVYDHWKILGQVASPIPSHIRRQAEVFLCSNRFYDVPLNVLVMFLLQAQKGLIPTRSRPVVGSDIQGGLIYVHKESGSAGSHWSHDGFTFGTHATKRYPLLPTDGNIFEEVAAYSTPKPGESAGSAFQRKAIWLSFCPNLIVIQYVGNESQGKLPYQPLDKLVDADGAPIAVKTPTKAVGPTECVTISDDDELIPPVLQRFANLPGVTLAKQSTRSPSSTPSQPSPRSRAPLASAPNSLMARLANLKGISLTPPKVEPGGNGHSGSRLLPGTQTPTKDNSLPSQPAQGTPKDKAANWSVSVLDRGLRTPKRGDREAVDSPGPTPPNRFGSPSMHFRGDKNSPGSSSRLYEARRRVSLAPGSSHLAAQDPLATSQTSSNCFSSSGSNVEVIDLDDDDGPQIVSTKSLAGERASREELMATCSTPSKGSYPANVPSPSESHQSQDKSPPTKARPATIGSLSISLARGKAQKGPKIAPRRNLPTPPKQSQYKELRQMRQTSNEDRSDLAAENNASEEEEIEILDEQLPPEKDRSKLVQVAVKPSELKALKNLGFTVFKTEK